jgi:hypothetical protein
MVKCQMWDEHNTCLRIKRKTSMDKRSWGKSQGRDQTRVGL